MSNQVFKIGEIVIYVGSVDNPMCMGVLSAGDEVTLVKYFGAVDRWEIDRKALNGDTIWSKTSSLRKRKPPASPFSFQEILDMCNDKTIINPITEPEVKAGLKGILQPFDNWYEGAP